MLWCVYVCVIALIATIGRPKQGREIFVEPRCSGFCRSPSRSNILPRQQQQPLRERVTTTNRHCCHEHHNFLPLSGQGFSVKEKHQGGQTRRGVDWYHVGVQDVSSEASV